MIGLHLKRFCRFVRNDGVLPHEDYHFCFDISFAKYAGEEVLWNLDRLYHTDVEGRYIGESDLVGSKTSFGLAGQLASIHCRTVGHDRVRVKCAVDFNVAVKVIADFLLHDGGLCATSHHDNFVDVVFIHCGGF